MLLRLSELHRVRATLDDLNVYNIITNNMNASFAMKTLTKAITPPSEVVVVCVCVCVCEEESGTCSLSSSLSLV